MSPPRLDEALKCEQFADAQTPEGAREDPFYLDLAPDYHHKDDFSGGASYGMAPGGGWLAPWLHFRWTTPSACAPSDTPDLVSYLRASILEFAGFPGCMGRPGFEKLRDRLLRRVEPF